MEKTVLRTVPTALVVACCTLAVCLGASTEALAFINGTRAIGFSARSIGMGGMDIAVASDSTSINTNPAGMAQIESGIADVNMSILTFWNVDMFNPNNPDGITDKDRFALAPTAGAVYRPGGPGSKWVFGFSLAAPDALATDWTVTSNYFNAVPAPLNPDPDTNRTSKLNAYSEWIHLRLSPAVAYSITKTLSVGARFGLDYMTLDLRAPLGRSYLDLGTADAFGFSFGFGLLYRPSDRFRIGVSGETRAYMADLDTRKGDAFVKLDVSGLDLGLGPFPAGTILEFDDMKASVSGFDAPPVIGVGLAFEPTDRILVGVDYRYLFWSSTNDTMLIRFRGGDVAAMPVDRLKIPFRYEDSSVVAVGGSYKLMDWMVLRAGYNYGEVVTAPNFANYLAPVVFDHHLTLGSSIFLGKLELAAAWVHSFQNTVKNRAESGVDQSVTKQLGGLPIDSELNNMKLEASWDVFALQFSFRF